MEIGDTIHLELIDNNQEKLLYSAVVIERRRGFILIDIPVHKETQERVFFMDGTEITAWFIGKDHAVYSFFTEVTGKKSNSRNTLLLKDPGKKKYRRIQRRSHVRVKASIDVAVHPVKEDASPFVTTSLDISGGGLAITTVDDYSLEAGDEVNTWLVLYYLDGSIQYVKALSKIVWISHGESAHFNRYSLKFVQMNEEDRQKVIDYCFEKQRPRRTVKSRNH